jgi:lipooligosaccharide transport system permease protein
VAFGFASFGMAITSYFKTYQQMGFINFVLLPMTLFSGSLYPISVYPDWLEKIIMALPLWHAIEMVRAFWFGNLTSGVLIHIGYFIVMIAIGLFVTSRRLRALFLR